MVKIFIAAVLLCLPLLYAQEQQEISSKKNELTRLRDEIKKLELEIKENSRTEKKTLETLDKMRKQAFILSLLISNLRAEEERKQQEINITVSDISTLEKTIEELKKNYARSIVGLYKFGSPSDIDILLNSGSINQALLRKKYLRQFSDKRKNDLERLRTGISELTLLRNKLLNERNEKSLLAKEKAEEETVLKKRMTDNSNLIARLKKNKSDLKKEIVSRKKAEAKISALINKLIADAERKKREERLRLAELEKNKKAGVKGSEIVSTEFDIVTAGLPSFSAMKGKLNWPLQGKIKGRYGEERNQVLKTVTVNYGVDILGGRDLTVKAVADGIVSAIEWIPGYGSVVIITHSEDFRTVYSRLSEIYVKEGEKINAGIPLAKVGESLEGNILHFEIWNSRNNQNPEIWLARK